MTKTQKLRHCIGCTEDFYNGKNPMGVQECWMLKSAKLIWRKRVGVWQTPPWNQKAVRVFNCRHEKGNVFVRPEQTE